MGFNTMSRKETITAHTGADRGVDLELDRRGDRTVGGKILESRQSLLHLLPADVVREVGGARHRQVNRTLGGGGGRNIHGNEEPQSGKGHGLGEAGKNPVGIVPQGFAQKPVSGKLCQNDVTASRRFGSLAWNHAAMFCVWT